MEQEDPSEALSSSLSLSSKLGQLSRPGELSEALASVLRKRPRSGEGQAVHTIVKGRGKWFCKWQVESAHGRPEERVLEGVLPQQL